MPARPSATPPTQYFDAHAHLGDTPEDADTTWLVPGVDGPTDGAAPRGPRIHRAVGLHPWYLDGDLEGALAELAARAAEPSVVAIGETGLDSMRRAGPRDRQEAAFAYQIELANRRQLPLILHVVRRHGACLARLREHGFPARLGGMVHDFGGPIEVIPEWVAAGFLLSISPRSVDAANQDARRAVLAAIPDDSLLIETDDFGPERLGEVIALLAQARQTSEERIAALTSANARRLFSLDSARFMQQLPAP